ncbi:MAG: peptidylprolyl isomerase [Acetobacteraceae bacterium]|nr:peptidylprolyl isomerase [Pseudomonadota bacterium]
MPSLFHRLGLPAALSLCMAVACGAAMAQSGKKQPVSPVAPPTTKAPAIDTTTPVLNPRAARKAAETVVAEVEGRPITLGEVADAIRALPPADQKRPYDDLFQMVINRLVRVQALLIQAQRQGIEGDPEVRRRMKAASDAVLVSEYLRRENEKLATEQVLLDRYQKDVAGKPGPEELHLWGIQVPTEAQARAIIAELQGGADFATVARKASQDVTAINGGDLGWVTRAELAPEVAGVAFGTLPGTLVTTPIAGPAGWLVIKVEARRPRAAPPFTAVRSQLLNAMTQETTPDLANKALAQVTVREYGLSGQELDFQTGEPVEYRPGRAPGEK